jgi:assimilatory nitrate reductase catalytic subunit
VTTIRPDTVFVPFHWVGANRLTNDALDPASRMPEFKVCAASVVAEASLVEEVAQRPSRNPVTHA